MPRLLVVLLFLPVFPAMAVNAGQQVVEGQPPSDVGGHPSVRLGPVKLDMKVRFESTLRAPTPDIGFDRADLAVGTRRAGIEGTVWKRVAFELERDFRARPSPWRDAYVGLRATKALRVQAGRFKIPFSRDVLTASANRDFIYRSLGARQLSPSRDTGIMTHGRLFGHDLEYQAGYFIGDGDHSHTAQTAGGRDAIAARVVIAPLAWTSVDPLAALQLGASAFRSHIDQRLGLRGETALGDGTFFDRVFVNGTRRRAGFEATWAAGPASASAEYITATDERRGMGFERTDLAAVRATAWYVAATWTLTGEPKDGRVQPRRGLFDGGYGAFELAARIERLAFDGAEYPGTAFGFPNTAALAGNSDRVTTIGVNWYLNRYLKLQVNVIKESIDDPQRSPAPGSGGRFTVGVARFQFLL